jgi:hypothetical protein
MYLDTCIMFNKLNQPAQRMHLNVFLFLPFLLFLYVL